MEEIGGRFPLSALYHLQAVQDVEAVRFLTRLFHLGGQAPAVPKVEEASDDHDKHRQKAQVHHAGVVPQLELLALVQIVDDELPHVRLGQMERHLTRGGAVFFLLSNECSVIGRTIK